VRDGVVRTLNVAASFALLLSTIASAGWQEACKPRPRPEQNADLWSAVGMEKEAERYLTDAAFRRNAMEQTFSNPKNTYSNERLSHYGFRDHGWDLLPEWNPRSVQITQDLAERTRKGETFENPPPLWNGRKPESWQGWTELGREVFFRYPLRSEVFVKFALGNPSVAERYGIHTTQDGAMPGLVAFVDEGGQKQFGITCALCHASVSASGRMLIGEARRDFDFGALRLAYATESGTSIESGLASRFHRWGPGRADVTEDDDEDPVAIPDLWGLKHQTSLTQAGTIKQIGPVSLMLRQETQLLTANHQKTRPPRVLAAALALYVYSLEAPALESAGQAAQPTLAVSAVAQGADD
jgi:hypothetical protein